MSKYRGKINGIPATPKAIRRIAEQIIKINEAWLSFHPKDLNFNERRG